MASFVRRGYIQVAGGGPAQPLAIEYEKNSEEVIVEVIAKLDEIGDTIDGYVSNSEALELMRSLENLEPSNAVTTSLDADIINLLAAREGVATRVYIENGSAYTVFNIAWGYDMGASFAHVTTNISPEVTVAPIDFFCTADIVQIRDDLSDAILFESRKGTQRMQTARPSEDDL